MKAVSERAFITPKVLRWARERARLKLDHVAHRIRTDAKSFASWERGEVSPTLHQAQRLAEVLHVPFGYLFLPAPPEEKIPLPDFRTMAGSGAAKPSAELIDLLNDIILKQQWYRDYLVEQGSPRLAFEGRFSIRDATDDVARNIREVLHIDGSLRESCPGWDEFLTAIVRNAEASGVLVMRSGIVASNTHRRLLVHEFRGFAISDPIAPLVFINASDARTAQIFTVAHELAHVWLGSSGISNENLRDPETGGSNAVERFCNAAAAEVLAPAAEFSESWDESRPLEENLTVASRHFKVSRVVILRRALDLGRISRRQYLQQYERELPKSRGTSGTKGGHYYRTTLARNSPTFTNAVVQGTLGGRVLYRDAARLLNVGVPAIQKIADYLAKNRNAM